MELTDMQVNRKPLWTTLYKAVLEIHEKVEYERASIQDVEELLSNGMGTPQLENREATIPILVYIPVNRKASV